MAEEKDLVLGDEEFEYVEGLEETRANMAEAREAFVFLSEYNEDSAWVLENGYKRAVIRGKKQAFEIVLQGLKDMHKETFPPKEHTQTDSA